MKTLLFLILILSAAACTFNGNKSKSEKKMEKREKGTYGYDLELLKKHSNPIELGDGEARIIISPEYQGRVMTSTADGEQGMSFGWINHELIASGEVLKQINPVGGEERFWLGPEGGQYSIFFKSGSTLDFEEWETPACIDTDPFDVISSNDSSAVFGKSVQIRNYSNFIFDFDIERRIELLSSKKIQKELNIIFWQGVKNVGYTTVNQLKNTGNIAWEKENGLLSIWLLGMFNPSPGVTIFIPYKEDTESEYIVKDDYFGKIPKDRLVVENGIVFFKGDGNQRGKIGIPPQRALPVLGSYDEMNNLLTIVKCEIHKGITDYVNSAWEIQEFPYKGDAINSYNDGPLEDGGQLGPFYELETSSPALALRPGEMKEYRQSTFHFQGSEEELNAICQQVFDISLGEIKSIFH